ncbi:MAG: hypothetical protein ACI8TX_000053 [Hyphomicrobiaceae bacterium]
MDTVGDGLLNLGDRLAVPFARRVSVEVDLSGSNNLHQARDSPRVGIAGAWAARTIASTHRDLAWTSVCHGVDAPYRLSVC